MPIRFLGVTAMGLGLLLAGPALAKPAHHGHHPARHSIHRSAHRGADVRYAQSRYDYHSAGAVREEFSDGPRAQFRHEGRFDRGDFYRGRREGQVVENLRGDFTGGVGYGSNGDVPSFVDGYGQTHFFVGSFRPMAPGARFGASGFRRGF